MITSSVEMFAAFSRRYPEHRDELHERAAIMEYHGGLSRKRAESMAVLRLVDKYELWEELSEKTA